MVSKSKGLRTGHCVWEARRAPAGPPYIICGALAGRPDIDADRYGFCRAKRQLVGLVGFT